MRSQGAFLAIAAAVVCLASIPAAALAGARIEVAPAGALTKSGTLVITDGNGLVIECAATYSETWERNIPKVQGTAVASITNGIAEECTGENMFVRVETVILQLSTTTPKYYQFFRGTLPNITGLRMTADPLRILIRYREVMMPAREAGCLYQGAVGFDTVGRSRISQLVIQADQIVPLRLRLFGVLACPDAITVEGTFEVEPVQNLRLLN